MRYVQHDDDLADSIIDVLRFLVPSGWGIDPVEVRFHASQPQHGPIGTLVGWPVGEPNGASSGVYVEEQAVGEQELGEACTRFGKAGVPMQAVGAVRATSKGVLTWPQVGLEAA